MAEAGGVPVLNAALISARKGRGAERLTEPSRHHRRCIFAKLPEFIQRRTIPRRIPRVEFDHHRVVRVQRHLVLHMIGKLEKSRIGIDGRDEVPSAFPPLTIRVLLISIVNICP